MPAPQPVTKAVELYNRLISLPAGERDQIGAIEWQLRKLRRDNPSDSRAAVALLDAFIALGKAAEAHALVDEIRGRRLALDVQAGYTFLNELVDLGRFEEAIEFHAQRQDFANDAYAHSTAWQAAIGLGSLEGANTIAQRTGLLTTNAYQSFLLALEEAGLSSLFAGHQRTVAEVMNGRFTGYGCRFYDNPEEGLAEAAISLYVDADRLERRLMEQSIDEALMQYYEAAGREPTAYVPFITVSVHDVAGKPIIRHA